MAPTPSGPARVRRRLPVLLGCVALALAGLRAGPRALAGDAPRKPAAKAPVAPAIRWARSWQAARDEAAERNLLVFLHSHGST